ncbi:MAG TPA: hypothetical protein DIW77_11330 [Chromatiaceae bacterium]|nr:hypothetical protein [Chromatiaceae bacterium]
MWFGPFPSFGCPSFGVCQFNRPDSRAGLVTVDDTDSSAGEYSRCDAVGGCIGCDLPSIGNQDLKQADWKSDCYHTLIGVLQAPVDLSFSETVFDANARLYRPSDRHCASRIPLRMTKTQDQNIR